jgi:hypothetical protein
MKFVLAVLVLFAAIAARSQYVPGQDSMQSQIDRQILRFPGSQNLFGFETVKPNEIKRNGVSYDGILVELVKTSNPLQLVNPFAPAADYGVSEDNTVWDPITGQGTGLKVFSIQF